ncbi:hypothetical protein DV495_003328 [Geotrichum candidum]|uniref:C-8 sterol isomerase n=1 Tax=Geotrichum candidum TaxID=1173061 RepID=A0A0J9XB95_GEOCN|nr:hypothetical protein DV454_001172 [Geotrichum candidum]KAI9214847.1 hypothetical protein DS838_000346 [Geotrichum bryndzae]KAF5120057.1 hypothetical protein DV452_001304 [Geotrichum candidum]KAF5126679.1 hypothetical protein DV495_003328 [Geotrichum candidum]KAF7501332.1 hypothetical protein DV113_000582 [Geotrichum candidum]
MRLSFLALIPFVFYTFRLLAFVKDTYLPSFFVFDHEILQKLSQEAIAETEGASSPNALFESLHSKLKATYGNYISEYNYNDWMFNNAGGAMGQMIILHASFTEYLIIFGSAVGTEGHTGHHLADDYFVILSGVQTASYSNQTVASQYKPGDKHHLPYGYAKQYSLTSGGFALELAQGYIPTMLIFGFADSIFSTTDPFNLGRQIYFTAKSMLKNTLIGKI